MKLDKQTIRRRNDDNLIPMINVVFLLLVFFMVAGTLRKSEPLSLEPVKSAQQQLLSTPVNLYLGLDGTLVLDGVTVSEETLIVKLANTRSTLALKTDANIKMQELRKIFATLRAAGITELELVTEWEPSSIEAVKP